jgi:4-hydroxythreonine-4-phosphate dehydrogenase
MPALRYSLSNRSRNKLKKILITMGDPGGVGPEIIAKALGVPGIRQSCISIVVGDKIIMAKTLDLLRDSRKLLEITSPDEAENGGRLVHIINVKSSGLPTIPQRKPTAAGGKACVSYIRKAVELALLRQVDGIVTAPISKEALKKSGFNWPGHTEMLAELSGTKEYAMMLAGGRLRVILVTIHTALKNVPHLITTQRILRVIRLAKKACDMLKIETPRIGVAGLNPHAGEAGIFGDEETTQIAPAVRQARREGIPVSGPYPPDSIFHKAYHGEFDIIVCMYHDQGLIPLKMIAFDKGVNVTLGLPFVRTSPDHGTAYDIAWEGVANPSSMIEAIKMAVNLSV